MTFLSQDLVWWITVFDLPALAGLFWMIRQVRSENESAIDHLQTLLDHRSDQLREALHAFKLEAAKTYASHGDLRDLEGRLTAHLLRIESKLDSTALKAEAATARAD
ncbi:MAG: hypothetical protein K9G62_04180 [Alphaproteobacteria bacterium]|nr:hypothetical protein [Alphaproteobacteria bacterium]